MRLKSSDIRCELVGLRSRLEITLARIRSVPAALILGHQSATFLVADTVFPEGNP